MNTSAQFAPSDPFSTAADVRGVIHAVGVQAPQPRLRNLAVLPGSLPPNTAPTGNGNLVVPTRNGRLYRGVRRSHANWLQVLNAVDPRGAISFASAAKWWGIPLPPGLAAPEDIHVSLSAVTNSVGAKSTGPKSTGNLSMQSISMRYPGVIAHRVKTLDTEIWSVRGLRITSPARTWLDLARVLDVADLTAAADFLICQYQRESRRRAHIASPTQLRAVLAANTGMRGIQTARTALELARNGVVSRPDSLLRVALWEAGLPMPDTNIRVEVFNARGEVDTRWIDVGYRAFRICVHHEPSPRPRFEPVMSTIRQDAQLADRGWYTVRVSTDQLNDGLGEVINQVLALLRGRGWRGKIEPRELRVARLTGPGLRGL